MLLKLVDIVFFHMASGNTRTGITSVITTVLLFEERFRMFIYTNPQTQPHILFSEMFFIDCHFQIQEINT